MKWAPSVEKKHPAGLLWVFLLSWHDVMNAWCQMKRSDGWIKDIKSTNTWLLSHCKASWHLRFCISSSKVDLLVCFQSWVTYGECTGRTSSKLQIVMRSDVKAEPQHPNKPLWIILNRIAPLKTKLLLGVALHVVWKPQWYYFSGSNYFGLTIF